MLYFTAAFSVFDHILYFQYLYFQYKMCICNFEYALISYYNTHNRFIIHIVD